MTNIIFRAYCSDLLYLGSECMPASDRTTSDGGGRCRGPKATGEEGLATSIGVVQDESGQ